MTTTHQTVVTYAHAALPGSTIDLCAHHASDTRRAVAIFGSLGPAQPVPHEGVCAACTPRFGYLPHDHATPWQECDSCGLRIGEGLWTVYDAAYYAGDPSVCPRCTVGLMCLPITPELLVGDGFGPARS